MKRINIKTLAKLLVKELITKAQALGLERCDSFVLTIKQEIIDLAKSYELARTVNESFDLRDYVRNVKEKIHYGLLFTTEDLTFTA
jgi:hypothetical protein